MFYISGVEVLSTKRRLALKEKFLSSSLKQSTWTIQLWTLSLNARFVNGLRRLESIGIAWNAAAILTILRMWAAVINVATRMKRLIVRNI